MQKLLYKTSTPFAQQESVRHLYRRIHHLPRLNNRGAMPDRSLICFKTFARIAKREVNDSGIRLIEGDWPLGFSQQLWSLKPRVLLFLLVYP